MFHSRTLNHKIYSVNKRASRIPYNDRISSFEELLRKDKNVFIHHRNLQVLATEILKTKNNMAAEILNDFFQNRTSLCNLRKSSSFYVKH